MMTSDAPVHVAPSVLPRSLPEKGGSRCSTPGIHGSEDQILEHQRVLFPRGFTPMRHHQAAATPSASLRR